MRLPVSNRPRPYKLAQERTAPGSYPTPSLINKSRPPSIIMRAVAIVLPTVIFFSATTLLLSMSSKPHLRHNLPYPTRAAAFVPLPSITSSPIRPSHSSNSNPRSVAVHSRPEGLGTNVPPVNHEAPEGVSCAPIHTDVPDDVSEAAVDTTQSSGKRRVLQGVGGAVAGLVLSGVGTMVYSQSAKAENAGTGESSEVVQCLFSKCRLELFECLANTVCAANLVCLSQCTGKPDEIGCQVRCGDLFQTSAIDRFNDCAISRGKCVPQRADESLYPIPSPQSLTPQFDMSKFTGNWFISLGQNDLFDIFDCQLHTFSYDAKKSMLVGELQWRVTTPDGGFLTRSTEQTFRQDPNQPSLLINDGNEFLHYSDNWYIASAQITGEETDHVLVYYRGINDAWDGYGGAVLYTRQPTMPKALAPTIQAACEKLPNIKYSDLKPTNNFCGKEPELLTRLETTTEKAEKVIIGALETEEEIVFGGIEERILELEGEVYKDQKVNSMIGQEVVNDLAFFLKGFERDVDEGVKETEKQLVGYANRLGKAIVSGEKKITSGGIFPRFFRFLTRQEEKVLSELEMDVKDVEDLLENTFGNGVVGVFSTKPVARVTSVAAK